MSVVHKEYPSKDIWFTEGSGGEWGFPKWKTAFLNPVSYTHLDVYKRQTITSIIGGMQLFDVPATLTNGTGDPNKAVLTTAMYLYNLSLIHI